MATLGAAREEEELNELSAEALSLRQLLLRIKLTTGLRQLRRERVHKVEMRTALTAAARDAPLLSEMGSSERRQKQLAIELATAQADLERHTNELDFLLRQKRQLHRATTRLLTYREGHEGELANLDDGKLDDHLERAMRTYSAIDSPTADSAAAALRAGLTSISKAPPGQESAAEAMKAVQKQRSLLAPEMVEAATEVTTEEDLQPSPTFSNHPSHAFARLRTPSHASSRLLTPSHAFYQVTPTRPPRSPARSAAPSTASMPLSLPGAISCTHGMSGRSSCVQSVSCTQRRMAGQVWPWPGQMTRRCSPLSTTSSSVPIPRSVSSHWLVATRPTSSRTFEKTMGSSSTHRPLEA